MARKHLVLASSLPLSEFCPIGRVGLTQVLQLAGEVATMRITIARSAGAYPEFVIHRKNSTGRLP